MSHQFSKMNNLVFTKKYSSFDVSPLITDDLLSTVCQRQVLFMTLDISCIEIPVIMFKFEIPI